MRLVIQRVRRASVTVGNDVIARIGRGALVLVAAARGDGPGEIARLARKTAHLRIYDDAEGRLNEDITAVGGVFLVVSQFTLYGDCRKGNRPSYTGRRRRRRGGKDTKRSCGTCASWATPSRRAALEQRCRSSW